MQGLFFLNSEFLMQNSEALSKRVLADAGPGPESQIERAHRLLYGRSPSKKEMSLALEFLEKSDNAWSRLAHVWLTSNEFRYVE